MQNKEKLKNSKKVIHFLASRFPECFFLEGQPKPLKIGIFNDLIARLKDEPNLTKTLLRSALRRYTTSWRYLHNVKRGASRIDLDGKPCGDVDDAHVEYAKATLKAAKAKLAANQGKANTAKNTPTKKAHRETHQPAHLKIGQNVKVFFGKKQVTATIKEVSKEIVQVELPTGLVMRVPPSNLKTK